MKKSLSLLMVLIMVVASFAGCGKSSSTETESANPTQAAEPSTTEAAAETEETYNVVMQWPSIGETPANLADVEAAINAITEPAIGATVTLSPVGAFDAANQTSLAVSSGEKLDLCVSIFSGVGSIVNSGAIIPLDDLVNQYGADILATCGAGISGGYYGTTLYGIPVAGAKGSTYNFVCRTDMLEKYGLTVEPNKYYTLDDLDAFFAPIHEGEGDSFYMISGTYADMFNFVKPNDTLGATVASGALVLGDGAWDNNKIVNLFETDEYAAMAQKLYDWMQAGYRPTDAATNTEEATSLIKGGNYFGFFTTGPAEDLEGNVGMDLTTIPMVKAYSASNMFQSVLWSIPITCENPEKTMQFLNMLYNTPELDNLLMYGIEGVDYDVVQKDDHGMVIQQRADKQYTQMFGVYGDRFSWAVMPPYTTTTQDEKRAESDAITDKSPALGYSFANADMSAQISAITSVIQQYQWIIETGSVNPATQLPEFISALKSAGIDEVIAANQSAYDAWLATK